MDDSGVFKTFPILMLVMFLAACADPNQIQNVSDEAAAILSPPSKTLSEFSEFVLEDMTFSDQITQDQGKLREARDFEAYYRGRLMPLIDSWNANSIEGASGKLLIKSDVSGLRIISSGARFWAGIFAGSSSIDMRLSLVDASTGEIIANPLIRRSTGAGGMTSTGETDENLDVYIGSIVHTYLSRHYGAETLMTGEESLTTDKTPEAVGLSGTYRSEMTGGQMSKKAELMEIEQNGNKIYGRTANKEWEIEGVLSGDTIKYIWYGPANSGKGEFTVDSYGNWIGKYTGQWGGGQWTLTKFE